MNDLKQTLRLHRFLPESRANGPGRRAVIWVQGCSLGCPGCFNPDAQDPDAGQLVTVAEIWGWLKRGQSQIEGVSFSGGEPLQQMAAVLAILRLVRQETDLSSLLFTGYRWEELEAMPQAAELLSYIDVLIAGPYRPDLHMSGGLRGSSNQSLHLLTDRYSARDLATAPPAEILIGPDGDVILSGVDPVDWDK